MSKPVVAHYISKYLSIPENWIYKILANLNLHEPIMLTRVKENPGLYPIKHLFSLDDFSKPRQIFELLYFKTFGYFWFFLRRCEEYNVRVLHVHFGYHGVKMIGLKRKLNIPMVCSFYGDDAFSFPIDKINHSRYQMLFKQADMILVLGPYMKTAIMKLGCDEEKIRIHHLGIEVDKIEFKLRSVSSDEPVRFLMASSFVEKKGIELAIQALSQLKDKYEFSLDIIGDGILRPQVLQEITKSGLGGRVVMHGYKPYDFFIRKAQDCHVLIQASRTGKKNNKEGTPMAIVDAMATGMAIVSTQHSDIPEIVVDGEHGYLAKENDLDSLKGCLEEILKHPENISQFGRNGREKVTKEFNAKIQVEKLEEIYAQLLAR